MTKSISEIIESDRLVIRNGVLSECSELQLICNTWEDKQLVEGENFQSDYILKCLKQGDLPPIPNANKNNYSFKSIYSKKLKKIIGFIDIYHGYPREDTIWISIFVLHKNFGNKGIGQEVIEYILKDAMKTDYKKIALGVQLKNWSALRFWTKAGFDKIVGIYGDKNYSENNFALIGLEKSLLEK